MTIMNKSIPREIFRAYDIRGILGSQLTPALFEKIGMGFGTMMRDEKQDALAVGYDGRLSSPDLAAGLIKGLRHTGRKVIRVGMVPTPCLYHAVHKLKLGGGIMITGSHNPPEYNGCKMMMSGRTLAMDDIQRLYGYCADAGLPNSNSSGTQEEPDFPPQYARDLIDHRPLSRSCRLVVDSGNGVTGAFAPAIYRALGAEVDELYCEVDGNFPNHHPDPGKPENLRDLQKEVARKKADLGFAFDGDGDRLGLVTGAGTIIYPDRMMMLFARDLLQRKPGAKIVFDVKCTSRLPEFIKAHGGEPIMWKTGHSLIKRKMKETGALLGGEMSGHLFFAEDWTGADDALLAGVRLLRIIEKSGKNIEDLCAELPDSISTPEINLTVGEKEKSDIMDKLITQGTFETDKIITIDGLRAEYADGWGLVRASNTSPILVLRFEAETRNALQRIAAIFRRELKKCSVRTETDFGA